MLKKILTLLIILLVISGCIEQPTGVNKTNASVVPEESNILLRRNVSLQKNLTEVSFSYVIPINRTIVDYEISPSTIERHIFQYINIDKLGDTNISFYLRYDNLELPYFSIVPNSRHSYPWTPPMTHSYFFKVIYSKEGRPVELNFSIGQVNVSEEFYTYFESIWNERKKTGYPDYSIENFSTYREFVEWHRKIHEYSGKPLEDWNVKLIIKETPKEYYINFTILEPIPAIDK